MNYLKNFLIFAAFVVFAFLLVTNLHGNPSDSTYVSKGAKQVFTTVFNHSIVFDPPLNCAVYTNTNDFDSDRNGEFKDSKLGTKVGNIITLKSFSGDANKCIYFWCDYGTKQLFCFKGKEYSTLLSKPNYGRLCIDPTKSVVGGVDYRFDYFWWDGNGFPPFPDNYPYDSQVIQNGDSYNFTQVISDASTPTGKDCSVGVRENNILVNTFSVYPTPLLQSMHGNMITLKMNSNYHGEIYGIFIYDYTGRRVLSVSRLTERELTINVGNLRTGTYRIEMNYPGKVDSKPLIIMR